MQPLVSVIMPVYNAERHLEEAIQSILNQTYDNIELIIINDGSTDQSQNIIKTIQLKDTRIRLVSRENRGIARTLNEAVMMAAGEYVARMDSDDFSCEERIEKQVAYLETHKEIDLCGTFVAVNSKENIRQYPETDEEIRKFMFLGNPFAHPTVMWRKGVVNIEDMAYNPDYDAEDYDLWSRFVIKHKVANIPEPLLIYRVDGTNISIKKAKQMLLSNHRVRRQYCLLMKVKYDMETPFEESSSDDRELEQRTQYFMYVLELQGSNALCLPIVEYSYIQSALEQRKQGYKDIIDEYMLQFGQYYLEQQQIDRCKDNIKKAYKRRQVRNVVMDHQLLKSLYKLIKK